ncbi:MAG: ABC transporter permease [bacterium]|nr:ABC transporter permease [bacterium]
MNQPSYVVYTSGKSRKKGIEIWKDMCLELIRSRELISRLFIRDLIGRYKQSLFGHLWVVINPFVAIGTFILLNRAGILNIGHTDIPYPLFALIGLSVWQLFSGGVMIASHSILSAGGMISKINFPREALVFSAMGQVIFDFLVRFCLIVLFFIIFKFVPSWGILLFPFALIPLIFLTLGLGMLLSIVNTVIRDTANIVSIFITFLMFLTPVLYPVPLRFSRVFKFNPLSPLITAPRDLIAYGYIKEPTGFWIMSVVSVLIFLVCWQIFHLAETKLPERL